MAISPKKADEIDEEDRKLLAKLEELVDSRLKHQYSSKDGWSKLGVSIILYDHDLTKTIGIAELPPNLFQELRQRYIDNGWSNVKIRREPPNDYDGLIVPKY